MKLDDMLFAYGKRKMEKKINIKLNEKRSQLLGESIEANLMEQADLYGKQMDMVENASNSFGIGRSRSRKNILRDRGLYEKKLLENLIVKSIYDIFNDALILDEDFKEKYRGNLYNLTESVYKSMITDKGLKVADLKRESSGIMCEILELCEDYARKVAKEEYPLNEAKKYSHTSKEMKPIDVNLDRDGDFYAEKNFASKSISSLVKDKVVQVISDEKKYAEDQEEFNLELDDKLDDRTGVDPSDIMMDEDEDEEMTNDDLSESEDETNGGDRIEADGDGNMPDPISKEQKDGGLKENYVFQFKKINKKHGKLRESTLFNSITLSIAKKNTEELKTLSEDGNGVLDMNLVFAESIAYYTLLETLYTTKLMNVNANEVRSIAKSLII